MDREHQVRLNFLEEAEQYYNRMESVLVGLAERGAEPRQLDELLRLVHSVKGGAGMMDFIALSQVAHRLEDFLKILRVRYPAQPLDHELETLLLRGMDCLRQVSERHRQGVDVTEAWLTQTTQPLFAQLQSRLGELRPEDENALLALEEDVDVSLILFESGVEDALNRLEARLAKPTNVVQLAQELEAVATELMALGRMRDLEVFIQLCQSVSQQVRILPPTQIEALARQSLNLWRQSLALVLLGRPEQLSSELALPLEMAAADHDPAPMAAPDWLSSELTPLEQALGSAVADLDNLSNDDLGITNLDIIALDITNLDLDELDLDTLDLTGLDLSALPLEEAEPGKRQPTPPATAAVEAPAPATLQELSELISSRLTPIPTPAVAAESLGKTVRVPLEQLQRLNSLCSDLVLERNALNLRLDQLKSLVTLLRSRMSRLEQGNTQLQKCYDQAAPTEPEVLPELVTSLSMSPPQPVVPERGQWHTDPTPTDYSRQFDALEMDSYTDVHLLAQNQMETTVQLREVATDVEFSLRELQQIAQSLDQTTRDLQDSATRMQMHPFAELVERFPRTVRDWSVKFGKLVHLKLAGESTLLAQEAIEGLSDPLLHLLRNAFDHGIEPAAARIAASKPEQGTITLRAAHQGNKTLIMISDDGQGINLEQIREKARKLGFPASLLTTTNPQELLELIFEPGFSTAEQVSELSGRGIGLDVVRTNLQQLRGEVQVSTQAGVGTTFTLSLPFNLSILSVLLLENAGLVFSIAADSVREVLRPNPEQLVTRSGQEYLLWQEQSVPLVRLEQWLAGSRPGQPTRLEGTPTINQPTILLVGQGTSLRSVYVERVWGEQEVAIRPINSLLPLPPGFFSSSLLGDGRVVPLVDLIQLTDWIMAGNATPPIYPQPTPLNPSPTILVVDDSTTIRRYLAMVLEQAGYRVEQSRDGRDAVNQLLRGLNVQAVICDIEMPRLDGYGVLSELRAKPEFQALPIVMLSSRSGSKHRKIATHLGASGYLVKPCTDQELLDYLKEILAREGDV